MHVKFNCRLEALSHKLLGVCVTLHNVFIMFNNILCVLWLFVRAYYYVCLSVHIAQVKGKLLFKYYKSVVFPTDFLGYKSVVLLL